MPDAFARRTVEADLIERENHIISEDRIRLNRTLAETRAANTLSLVDEVERPLRHFGGSMVMIVRRFFFPLVALALAFISGPAGAQEAQKCKPEIRHCEPNFECPAPALADGDVSKCKPSYICTFDGCPFGWASKGEQYGQPSQPDKPDKPDKPKCGVPHGCKVKVRCPPGHTALDGFDVCPIIGDPDCLVDPCP